ncbi:fibronectin type III domain-containing protein, partial [Bacillus atrophaeus]
MCWKQSNHRPALKPLKISALKALRPNAPQNLSFTATTDSVTVKWDAVDGATSYKV